jgi:hypothetical protein
VGRRVRSRAGSEGETGGAKESGRIRKRKNSGRIQEEEQEEQEEEQEEEEDELERAGAE